MREIKGEAITQAVARLCMSANRNLPQDVRTCITQSQERESWEPARGILSKIVENYKIAEEDQLPICQDTGVACVFLEVGQEVHIQGDLEQAVNAGVHQGYLEAGLRCSVVADPLRRVGGRKHSPEPRTRGLLQADPTAARRPRPIRMARRFSDTPRRALPGGGSGCAPAGRGHRAHQWL